MSNIVVAGTGYVGLVTGTCFADLGNQVTCLDVDPAKVDMLRRGESPIYEPGLEEIIQRNIKAGRLTATTSYEKALQGAEFVFIAVGTPESPDGSADMQYVEAAARDIARFAPGRAQMPLIIINKSTVPIGTGDLVGRIVRENAPEPFPFSVVSNPEFLREGQAVQDCFHPDRVVLGSDDHAAAEQVGELYKPLEAPILITDIRTAEMIKYASNAILATYISFINEMAGICEELGADVKVVAQGMGYDKRINGTFLNAGVGFGGSCFPKDVKALAHMAESRNAHPHLLHAVIDINTGMRSKFVDKANRMLDGLKGKEVAVLGLTFKPDTDDLRETPAFDIIKGLQEHGAHVRAYDPIGMEGSAKVLKGVQFCSDSYEAATGADALLLVTAWNEFKQLDMKRIREAMKGSQPLLLDGRNVYDPGEMRELGFRYAGVGRS